MSAAQGPSRRARQLGFAGAAIGVVAAGVATALAVERALVRKSVNAPGDPYVDEPFGDQPCDKELIVTAPDGTDVRAEIVEPVAPTAKPTIVFVHGFGLAIAGGAVVGEGCILFQNVTLGRSLDGETGSTGAPRLERNVHVGVGATLVGPIVIGEGSKVMAGCFVRTSVPPRSLVEAPAPIVRPRGGR